MAAPPRPMGFHGVALLVTLATTVTACQRVRRGPGAADAATPIAPSPDEIAAAMGVQLATASEAEARAARVLPTTPSEDASALLVPPKFAAPSRADGPEDAVAWVIDIALPADRTVTGDQILTAFDGRWRDDHGVVQPYGRVSGDSPWKYLRSTGRERFRHVAVEIALAPAQLGSPAPSRRIEDLDRLRVAIATAVRPWGDVAISSRTTVEAAAKRALELAAATTELENALAVVVVVADDSFDGRKVWDVMLSLGLEWGDMDLFHWNIDGSQLFTVSTDTAPGYFFPEHLASGAMRPRNLVFELSIPRTEQPLAVLEAMFAAADYAAARLGGRVTDDDGRPINRLAVRKSVHAIVSRLDALGLPAGSGGALMTF